MRALVALLVAVLLALVAARRLRRRPPTSAGLGAPLVIVHLAHRRDREQNVRRTARLASRAGVRAVVLRATRGAAPEPVARFVDMTRWPFEARVHLRPGEAGCFASHARAWAMHTESGVIVAEDDAVPHADCVALLLRAAAPVREEACVVFGRYSAPRGARAVCAHPSAGDGLVELRCACYNANLYYATARAAAVLLRWRARRMPVDDYISSLGGCHPTRLVEPAPLRLLALAPGRVRVMRTRSDTA